MAEIQILEPHELDNVFQAALQLIMGESELCQSVQVGKVVECSQIAVCDLETRESGVALHKELGLRLDLLELDVAYGEGLDQLRLLIVRLGLESVVYGFDEHRHGVAGIINEYGFEYRQQAQWRACTIMHHNIYSIYNQSQCGGL